MATGLFDGTFFGARYMTRDKREALYIGEASSSDGSKKHKLFIKDMKTADIFDNEGHLVSGQINGEDIMYRTDNELVGSQATSSNIAPIYF